jgi:hypothetical protein
MSKKKSSERFTPTKWDTSADKEKFAEQFKKFVSGGYQLKHFPKWFYTRLSMTFGHIAHYNQGQFYETFFTTDADKTAFINQTMNWSMGGDPAWTYSDVEQHLQKWMKEYLRGE